MSTACQQKTPRRALKATDTCRQRLRRGGDLVYGRVRHWRVGTTGPRVACAGRLVDFYGVTFREMKDDDAEISPKSNEVDVSAIGTNQ
jgi:hypothetical protein